MKIIKALILSASLAIAGCATKTPQKIAVDSLAALGTSVNDAYEGYLQLVVQGNLATNSVPTVTAYYRDFQASYGAAAATAQWATNATFANPDLVTAGQRVINAIAIIKNGGH